MRALVPFAGLVLLAAPAAALALSNEPRGFGPARFGMPVRDVQRVLPAVKRLAGTPAGATPLALYTLESQSVHGLAPCAVQLYFVEDRLYEVTFDCGRSERVGTVLREQFGAPSEERDRGTFWFGERTVVTQNPRSRTFAFIDRALNQNAQTVLLQAARTEPGTPERP